MREHLEQQASIGPSTETAVATEPSPGAKRLTALLAAGATDPKLYGNVLANFPAERAALVAQLQQARGNAVVTQAMAWANRKGTREIGYLAMGVHRSKAAMLAQANADQGGVELIAAQTADARFDTDEEIEAAINAWGFSDEIETQLIGFCRPEPRAARFKFLRMLVEAERGQRRLERFLLTGHSGGSSIWDSNEIAFMELASLARLLPVAFGQVKHLMIGACSTGYAYNMNEMYPSIFPNLVTAWAYGGTGPGPDKGGNDHTRVWEQATEAPTARELPRDLSENRGHRHGEFVSTWSATAGFQGSPIAEHAGQLHEIFARWREFEACFNGLTPLDAADPGPLRSMYQFFLANAHTPEAANVGFDVAETARKTIRLLKWPKLVEKFWQVHGAIVQPAVAAVGVPLASVQQLERAPLKDALGELDGQIMLKEGLGQLTLSDPQREALGLLGKLWQLDFTVLPDTWL